MARIITAAKSPSRLGLALIMLALAVVFACGSGPALAAEAESKAEPMNEADSEGVRLKQENDHARSEALLRRQEAAVQSAVQMTALLEIAHQVDKGSYTANYDDLIPYGWQRDPDLIYEDIQLGQLPDGEPGFTVIIRHRASGPRAFKWDSGGKGVEPVE